MDSDFRFVLSVKKYVVSNIDLVDNLGCKDTLMTKQVRATIFLKS
jgi:hypothetical protein